MKERAMEISNKLAAQMCEAPPHAACCKSLVESWASVLKHTFPDSTSVSAKTTTKGVK